VRDGEREEQSSERVALYWGVLMDNSKLSVGFDEFE
jgi:hypothetical protein